MKVEQKKSKLIEDLVYQNGQLNCKLIQKNTLIGERIKALSMKKVDATGQRELDLLNEEINWLIKLADI